MQAPLFQFPDNLNPTFGSFGLSEAVKVLVVQSVCPSQAVVSLLAISSSPYGNH